MNPKVIPILTLGYQTFALPPGTKTGPLMDALQQATPVDYSYRTGRKAYYPNRHARGNELSVEFIHENDMLSAEPEAPKPTEPKPVNARPALPGPTQLALPGGSHGA